MSLYGGRSKGDGIREVRHQVSLSRPSLTNPRYLQDLQKRVEQQQRSPTNNIFDNAGQVDTTFTYRSPPTASAPPPYRSSMDAASVHSQNSHPSYCSPPMPSSQVGDNYSPGLKRTNDAAFGNDVNGECGVDTSLASPALTVGSQQQSDPSVKDPATSSYSQQTGESPLTIWPSAFTIPSKIIKNTRKNRRTWSECKNWCM